MSFVISNLQINNLSNYVVSSIQQLVDDDTLLCFVAHKAKT